MKLKIPSVVYIGESLVAAFRRFPATVLLSLIAFAIANQILPTHKNDEDLFRILGSILLGFPLSLSLSLAVENSKNGILANRILVNVASLTLVALHAWYSHYDQSATYIVRYFQLSLVLHLLVSIAPFITHESNHGFWHFNHQIFSRIIESFVFALVLGGGTAAALLAIEKLFSVSINSNWYSRIWLFAFVVFQTIYFIADLPEGAQLHAPTDKFPKSVKILSQYLLIPLVTLYTAILYAYMSKIILQHVWPEGLVAWLISGMSIAGIFTLLLIHPAQQNSSYQWLKAYSKYFYISILPLMIMYYVAVLKRIDQYGITERRYFLIVLGVWLIGICVYFLFSKAKNIQVIPTTLLIAGLVTFAGPWSAYSVSQRSQMHRLKNLLEKNHLLVDDKISKSQSEVPIVDRREISSVLDYLIQHHGTLEIEKWFGDIQDLKKRSHFDLYYHQYWGFADQTSEALVRMLGFDYVSQSNVTPSAITEYAIDNANSALEISGYDYIVNFFPGSNFAISDVNYRIRADSSKTGLTLTMANETVDISLLPLFDRLKKYTGEPRKTPRDLLTLVVDEKNVRAKIVFSSFETVVHGDKTEVGPFYGRFLLKK